MNTCWARSGECFVLCLQGGSGFQQQLKRFISIEADVFIVSEYLSSVRSTSWKRVGATARVPGLRAFCCGWVWRSCPRGAWLVSWRHGRIPPQVREICVRTLSSGTLCSNPGWGNSMFEPRVRGTLCSNPWVRQLTLQGLGFTRVRT